MSTLPTPRTDAWLKEPDQRTTTSALNLARQLERELTEAKAERDALDGMNKSLATMLRAYSVDPSRISNTEIAMARVALDERSADLADLSRWRSLAEELAGALDSIPPCDVSSDARFVYKTESWKWAEAMERRNVALARYRDAANPASGAAIAPVIHRSE